MSLEAAVVRLAEAVEELSDALINRRWENEPPKVPVTACHREQDGMDRCPAGTCADEETHPDDKPCWKLPA